MSRRKTGGGRSSIDLSFLANGEDVSPVAPGDVDPDDSSFDARNQTRFKANNMFSKGYASQLNNEQMLNAQDNANKLTTAKQLNKDKHDYEVNEQATRKIDSETLSRMQNGFAMGLKFGLTPEQLTDPANTSKLQQLFNSTFDKQLSGDKLDTTIAGQKTTAMTEHPDLIPREMEAGVASKEYDNIQKSMFNVQPGSTAIQLGNRNGGLPTGFSISQAPNNPQMQSIEGMQFPIPNTSVAAPVKVKYPALKAPINQPNLNGLQTTASINGGGNVGVSPIPSLSSNMPNRLSAMQLPTTAIARSSDLVNMPQQPPTTALGGVPITEYDFWNNIIKRIAPKGSSANP